MILGAIQQEAVRIAIWPFTGVCWSRCWFSSVGWTRIAGIKSSSRQSYQQSRNVTVKNRQLTKFRSSKCVTHIRAVYLQQRILARDRNRCGSLADLELCVHARVGVYLYVRGSHKFGESTRQDMNLVVARQQMRLAKLPLALDEPL